jgi:isopenicillin N synthase-like dioxygenase
MQEEPNVSLPLEDTARSLIPSIDLARLEGSERAAELEQLGRAARGLGAFFLRGHGIGAETAERVLTLSRRLFELPHADLEAIDMIHSPYFRGYSPVGSERTQGRPDLREQLDVGPEDQPHAPAPGEPPYLRLRGPNQWPGTLPELRPAILGWMTALRGVSTRLLAAVVESVGLPRETFAEGFAGRPHERLKIVKYPGVGPTSSKQGVGEHRDTGFLTIIVQDGIGGLQVHDGEAWVEVEARRGELIAILGRTLQYATDGYVTSALHRVASPPSSAERISVPYFFNPRLDYVVDPLPLGADQHAKEPATERDAYEADAADLVHSEYGYNALKVVLRSHPHVAKRYFADVLG